MIVRTLGEDPMLRAAAIDPSGKRQVYVINTGIDRDDPDPDYCTRESVAQALPEAKATIAGQRRWEQQRRAAQTAQIDRHNDSDSFVDRMAGHWLGLCQHFGLDYGEPTTSPTAASR